jgi:flagellar biosynthesis protein FlhF
VRAQLEANDLGSSVLVPLMERLEDALTEDASPEAVWRTAARRLAATLPPPVTIDVARRSSAVVLVGPSGAGKTTAAVRIGLELQRRGLVAVIAGTDVDRAGAPQQLEAFAAAAGIPAQLCYTPAEVQELVESNEADIVIMDTPGHDGSRVDYMAELNAFVRVLDDPTVLLTLPATTRAADLARIQQAYAALQPAGLAITRCDEGRAFGGVATIAVDAHLGVAFTTHDAAGSDALRTGDNHALATAVLRGGWPAVDRRPPARQARARAS